MLVFAMECANRYLPGIRAVIDGNAAKTALEAIAFLFVLEFLQ